jgi:hypothetical protein
VIKSLKAQLHDLELQTASLRVENKNLQYDNLFLQRKVDYTRGLLTLKDEVLQISSREHVRFMQLYLNRSDDMRTLRETNETLVRKILELSPAVYNAPSGVDIPTRLFATEKKQTKKLSLPTPSFAGSQPSCSPSPTPAARKNAPSAATPSLSRETPCPSVPADA